MYGGSYKIHGRDAKFERRLRKNHASPSKSETCSGLCMESGSWDMLKLKRKAKNKIDQNLLYEYFPSPRDPVGTSTTSTEGDSYMYNSTAPTIIQ